MTTDKISMKCPHCGAVREIDPCLAGLKSLCSTCFEQITIPSPTESPKKQPIEANTLSNPARHKVQMSDTYPSHADYKSVTQSLSQSSSASTLSEYTPANTPNSQSKNVENIGLLSGLLFLLKFVGVCLHLWTVIIAYHHDGLFGAIVSLLIPILAEIFYFFSMISHTNTVLNPYSTALIAYIFCYSFSFLSVNARPND